MQSLFGSLFDFHTLIAKKAATAVRQTNIQGAIEPIVLLVLVIRHLERMADHATNIGKRVAYIVTGQR